MTTKFLESVLEALEKCGDDAIFIISRTPNQRGISFQLRTQMDGCEQMISDDWQEYRWDLPGETVIGMMHRLLAYRKLRERNVAERRPETGFSG